MVGLDSIVCRDSRWLTQIHFAILGAEVTEVNEKVTEPDSADHIENAEHIENADVESDAKRKNRKYSKMLFLLNPHRITR